MCSFAEESSDPVQMQGTLLRIFFLDNLRELKLSIEVETNRSRLLVRGREACLEEVIARNRQGFTRV